MAGDGASTMQPICTDNGGLTPDVYVLKTNNNGQTWFLAATLNNWSPTDGLAYGAGKWVMGCNSGKFWSPDGVTWNGPFGARAYQVYWTGTHFLSGYTTTQSSTDAISWNDINTHPLTTTARLVCGVEAGPWFVFVRGVGIYRTDNQGTSWELKLALSASGGGADLQASACAYPLVAFADGGGGASAQIIGSNDNGDNFTTTLLSNDCYSLVPFPPGYA